MKNNKGNRHCFATVSEGTVKYYCVYDNEVIEVDKAVFDVIDRSYSKERYDARMQRKRHVISIEQMIDDTEEIDKHGNLSSAFWVSSAEEDFFANIANSEKENMLAIMWDEIGKLPFEEAELLKSYSYDNHAIRMLCESTGFSKSSLYYKRTKLAEDIKEKIRRRISHE